MKKTMSVYLFAAILAVMLIGFFVLKGKIDVKSAEAEAELSQQTTELQALQAEKTALKEELDICETDAYIEEKARKLYGYMDADEVRIIIVNPEILYENGVVPDRSK